MSRTTVLVWSLLALVITIVFSSISDGGSDLTFAVWLASFILLFVFWIGVTYAVFSDVKQQNKSPGWTVLTLFTGGVGGLIYYFVSNND